MMANHRCPIDFLYEAYQDDIEAFGPNWCGPQKFDYGKWALVAEYGASNSDGQPVSVYCCAMPARFYRLLVAATDSKPAYHVRTGTIGGKRAAALAKEIAQGMVGFHASDGSEVDS